MLSILHVPRGAKPTSPLKSAQPDGHVGLCRILSPYPLHTRARAPERDRREPYSTLHASCWPEVRHGC